MHRAKPQFNKTPINNPKSGCISSRCSSTQVHVHCIRLVTFTSIWGEVFSKPPNALGANNFAQKDMHIGEVGKRLTFVVEIGKKHF